MLRLTVQNENFEIRLIWSIDLLPCGNHRITTVLYRSSTLVEAVKLGHSQCQEAAYYHLITIKYVNVWRKDIKK